MNFKKYCNNYHIIRDSIIKKKWKKISNLEYKNVLRNCYYLVTLIMWWFFGDIQQNKCKLISRELKWDIPIKSTNQFLCPILTDQFRKWPLRTTSICTWILPNPTDCANYITLLSSNLGETLKKMSLCTLPSFTFLRWLSRTRQDL